MPNDTVILRAVNLRWIQDAADDPEDLCAHGEVEFRIGDDVLLDPDTCLTVTVSAAALYLLRTLSPPDAAGPANEPELPQQLFPCCGFSMIDVGEDDVLIIGCPSGHAFEVFHEENEDSLVVREGPNRQWRVGWAAWKTAVFGFADQVSAFYKACSPKTPSPDDEAGFRRFKSEWRRRRGIELGQSG